MTVTPQATCDGIPTLWVAKEHIRGVLRYLKMVGDELFRDPTPEKLDEVLERYCLRRDGDGATAHPEHQAR
jgi:hypothetical protein